MMNAFDTSLDFRLTATFINNFVGTSESSFSESHQIQVTCKLITTTVPIALGCDV